MSMSNSLSLPRYTDFLTIASLKEWNKEMDAAYEKQFEGIDEDDRAARRAVMQPIIDELAAFKQDGQETNKVKSALCRVRRCKKQFVNMVSNP